MGYDCCHLQNENSVFLPIDVSQIIMEFLNFRRDTFVFFRATPRKASDYVKYDKQIYPLTEFYLLVHKLLTYPKVYKVLKKTD